MYKLPTWENMKDDWDNDKGMILDSIPADWILFFSLYIILIGIILILLCISQRGNTNQQLQGIAIKQIKLQHLRNTDI